LTQPKVQFDEISSLQERYYFTQIWTLI